MHRNVSPSLVGVFLVLTSGFGVLAQEPISDKLEVTLDQTTWVGSQSLAPGTYRIRQLPTASSPRLLEFSSDNGTKMETAITTIAAIGNNTQHDTSVTLEQKDGQYHLTHVWIAGKTYGYQLPVESNLQQIANSKSETATLAANFVPNPRPQAQPEPTVAQAPEPVRQEPEQVAQAEPAPSVQAPQPVDAPQTPATPEPAPQSTPAPSAAADSADQTPPMPSTATHWPAFLLVGVLLVVVGLAVRPASLPIS